MELQPPGPAALLEQAGKGAPGIMGSEHSQWPSWGFLGKMGIPCIAVFGIKRPGRNFGIRRGNSWEDGGDLGGFKVESQIQAGWMLWMDLFGKKDQRIPTNVELVSPHLSIR